MKKLRTLFTGHEEGQILVLAALSTVVVLGVAALAIDVGVWLHTKAKLQADADAMALAGVQALEIGNDVPAIELAYDYGVRNGVKDSEIDSIEVGVESCGGAEDPHYLTVRLTRNRPAFLARVLDIADADISVCSTAVAALGIGTSASSVQMVGGFGFGARPFALERSCLEASPPGVTPGWPAVQLGDLVILKFDTDGKGTCQTSQGNFAAIRIDGSGSSVYEDTIKYGSKKALCTDTTPLCCPAPGCIASYGVYQTPTETGNMIGPTQRGIDYLINGTRAGCRTWEQVQSDGVLNPDCVPWSDTYNPNCGPLNITSCSPTKLLIVPIVDGLWDGGGNNTVTVKRFAIVFLVGYQGSCSGNSCDIQARFIRAEVNPTWAPLTNSCGGIDEPVCGDVIAPSINEGDQNDKGFKLVH